jgi:outer membrane protein TolC
LVSRQGALQPALHLPIFTAGKISANISSKIAKFNQAIERYNEALLSAVKEVASEITSLKTIDEQLKVQDSIVRAQKEKEILFTSRYVKGLDSQASCLRAKQENLQTKLYTVELQNYKMLSIIRLIKAIGGGYQSDELPSIASKR